MEISGIQCTTSGNLGGSPTVGDYDGIAGTLVDVKLTGLYMIMKLEKSRNLILVVEVKLAVQEIILKQEQLQIDD